MGLHIIGRTGRTGQVIIKDDGPGGTGALFVCETVDGGGIAVPPEQEAPSTRGRFPWVNLLQAQVGEDFEPFEFTVDTGSLPPGLHPFDTNRFITRVLEAVDEGVEEIQLSPETAEAWGYVGPLNREAGS